MQYRTTVTAGNSSNTIGIRATLAQSNALPTLGHEALLAPIVNLVNLAACGGLCGDQYSPQESKAELLLSTVSGLRVEWSIAVDRVATNLLHNVQNALLFLDSKILNYSLIEGIFSREKDFLKY